MRSNEYHNGRREAIKWAVTWLHNRAREMNDPNAVAVLNTAAFNMGQAAKRAVEAGSMDCQRKYENLKRLGFE